MSSDLRTLALAATPGPWEAYRDPEGSNWYVIGMDDIRAMSDYGADAAFIAAASPPVVLALLDCVSALRYHNLTPAGNVRSCLPECVACAAIARYEEVTRG